MYTYGMQWTGSFHISALNVKEIKISIVARAVLLWEKKILYMEIWISWFYT